MAGSSCTGAHCNIFASILTVCAGGVIWTLLSGSTARHLAASVSLLTHHTADTCHLLTRHSTAATAGTASRLLTHETLATADTSPLGPHVLVLQPRAGSHHTPGPVPATGLHAGSCQKVVKKVPELQELGPSLLLQRGDNLQAFLGCGKDHLEAVLPKEPQWLLYDSNDFAVLRR